MNNVKRNEISFVIQGILFPEIINLNITYIRRYFPEAEIIISTWSAQKEQLDMLKGHNEIVINTDPQTQYLSRISSYVNNFHRMNITSMSGVLRATRKYVFRMRSDLVLKKDGFLKYYNKYNHNTPSSFFSEKIIVMGASIAALSVRGKAIPTAFWAGDWMNFGTKEDLLKIWTDNIQIDKMQIYSRNNNFDNIDASTWFNPIPSEIWLFRNFIKLHFDKIPETLSSPNLETSKLWCSFIADNLIPLHPWQIGVKTCNKKYKCLTRYKPMAAYTKDKISFNTWRYNELIGKSNIFARLINSTAIIWWYKKNILNKDKDE